MWTLSLPLPTTNHVKCEFAGELVQAPSRNPVSQRSGEICTCGKRMDLEEKPKVSKGTGGLGKCARTFSIWT